MDARTLEELIREPQVKEELSFGAGLAVLRELAKDASHTGRLSEDEAAEIRQSMHHLEGLLRRPGVE
jgi:hypothetical protein